MFDKIFKQTELGLPASDGLAHFMEVIIFKGYDARGLFEIGHRVGHIWH